MHKSETGILKSHLKQPVRTESSSYQCILLTTYTINRQGLQTSKQAINSSADCREGPLSSP